MDEDLGLAYLPVETPSSDFYGGHRPGTNLFADSLVCVDLKTGQRKWHYQLVHHSIWNMDIAAGPVLADITVDGKPVKAVLESSKQAFMYVFDRVTGKPVWPIEERPVEKGDVPGEWYSPTQPFPTKPPAFDYQGVTVDNLIDFTPELRALAKDMVARYKLGPIFTPPVGGEQSRRAACLVPIVGWHELARVFVRSRNAHCLCTLVYFFSCGWSYSSTQQGILGYRLGRGRYSRGGSLRIWSGRKCGGRFEASTQGVGGSRRGCRSTGSGGRTRCTEPAGLAIAQAALRPDHGDQHGSRRVQAWQIAHTILPITCGIIRRLKV